MAGSVVGYRKSLNIGNTLSRPAELRNRFEGKPLAHSGTPEMDEPIHHESCRFKSFTKIRTRAIFARSSETTRRLARGWRRGEERGEIFYLESL
jgi:hypothetical protein